MSAPEEWDCILIYSEPMATWEKTMCDAVRGTEGRWKLSVRDYVAQVTRRRLPASARGRRRSRFPTPTPIPHSPQTMNDER